jgi:hypothetical protein
MPADSASCGLSIHRAMHIILLKAKYLAIAAGIYEAKYTRQQSILGLKTLKESTTFPN